MAFGMSKKSTSHSQRTRNALSKLFAKGVTQSEVEELIAAVLDDYIRSTRK